MTIYFVDEDVGQTASLRGELSMRGYEIRVLRSADEAWESLAGCQEAQLVIIDVMLAVENAGDLRFSRERTADYIATGLVLLEDLCKQNPVLFPRRALLLTMTGNERLLTKAQTQCDVLGIPLLRKGTFATPFEFGERIQEILDAFRVPAEAE